MLHSPKKPMGASPPQPDQQPQTPTMTMRSIDYRPVPGLCVDQPRQQTALPTNERMIIPRRSVEQLAAGPLVKKQRKNDQSASSGQNATPGWETSKVGTLLFRTAAIAIRQHEEKHTAAVAKAPKHHTE